MKTKSGKLEIKIEGDTAIISGKPKVVDMCNPKGIEITHPDGTKEVLEGVCKIIAVKIKTVKM